MTKLLQKCKGKAPSVLPQDVIPLRLPRPISTEVANVDGLLNSIPNGLTAPTVSFETIGNSAADIATCLSHNATQYGSYLSNVSMCKRSRLLTDDSNL
jgi:hypothetical protein